MIHVVTVDIFKVVLFRTQQCKIDPTLPNGHDVSSTGHLTAPLFQTAYRNYFSFHRTDSLDIQN
jgi:hypothetical protein